MRTPYRALTLTAGLLLTLFGATWSPSSAQDSTAASCQAGENGSEPPGALTSPSEGAVSNTGTVTVQAQFGYETDFLGRPEGQVNELRAHLIACDEQVLPEGSSTAQQGPTQAKHLNWPTPTLPWNGPYAVSVTARGSSGSRTIVRSFSIAVPPATPQSIRAAAGDGGVTVSWARNNEPDLLWYQVQRAARGGDFEALQPNVPASSGTGRVSFLDDTVTPGEWRYNVVAIRRGATSNQGLASDPSEEARATMTAPVSTTEPGSSTTTQGGGAAQTTATSTSASGSAAAPAAGTSIAKAGAVDLSNFGALVDTNRSSALARAEELADPGFQDRLPFQPGDEPVVEGAQSDSEPGTQVDRRVISDDSDRRRLLSFFAGALLFFVMFMQVRWLKREVERTDLEPAEPGVETGNEATAVAHESAEQPPMKVVLSEPASPIEVDPEPAPPMIELLGDPDRPDDAPVTIAAVAPVEAPHLDILDTPGQVRRRRTTRSTADAGRASRRVSSRPRNDRGEGRPPVRARRRGAGSSDHRVPHG